MGSALAGIGVRAQFYLQAREHRLLASDRLVLLTPRGINQFGGIRKRLRSIFDESVQAIVVPHILEEVFLTPPRKQSHRHSVQGPLVITGQHGRLVPVVFQLPHLAHPESVAQTGAPFGQPQLDFLAVDQTDLLPQELPMGPISLRKLVVRDHRDALGPQALE